MSWPLTLAALQDTLSSGPRLGRTSWTAVRSGSDTPVGHFSLTLLDGGRTVRIGRILLDPRLRNQGLGLQLIRSAISAADATGAKTQTLAVLEGNDRAAHIYLSHGFEPTGETTVVPVEGVGWTSIEMSRPAPGRL